MDPYEKEIMRLKRDIQLIEMEREKLLLEKGKSRPEMQTFLCENCGEYVIVPTEGVGQKVHWKCMACHQENCFEVSEE